MLTKSSFDARPRFVGAALIYAHINNNNKLTRIVHGQHEQMKHTKMKYNWRTYPDGNKRVQTHAHNCYPLDSPTVVDADSPSDASAQIQSPESETKKRVK